MGFVGFIFLASYFTFRKLFASRASKYRLTLLKDNPVSVLSVCLNAVREKPVMPLRTGRSGLTILFFFSPPASGEEDEYNVCNVGVLITSSLLFNGE